MVREVEEGWEVGGNSSKHHVVVEGVARVRGVRD
jgi:hypothetical protein